MKTYKQHQKDVENLKLGDGCIALAPSQKQQSNLTRKKEYLQGKQLLNIDHFDQILSIDIQNMTATVEAKVTIHTLVKETLKVGLVPLVVPEFKGITVAGAIMGASLESSSHLFGQFNDTVISCEVLLGNGRVVMASATENSDLFYGLSSSYGSLGIILSCTLRLEPASAFVHATYHRHHCLNAMKEHLEQLCSQENPPDYIEGLVFSKTHSVIVTGKKAFHPPEHLTKYRLRSWSPWFYKHAETAQKDELIPLYDYLFRYDRGAFWMASCLSDIRWLWKFFFHKNLKNLAFRHSSPLLNRLLPLFLGSWLSSQRLYKTLHSISDDWFQENFVVQDFYIPIEHLLEFVAESTEISPLWICPVRPTITPQILAPHYIQTPLLVDVGIYGLGKGKTLTLFLEQEAARLGGRKMLYAKSYYSKEEFWQIYANDTYTALRAKYDASNHFPSIDMKVL